MIPECTFTILYTVFCYCIIYPPTEFISLGLTIPSVFGSLLGSEDEDFIRYHLKRSTLTLIIYSSLPLGFILGLAYWACEKNVTALIEQQLFWQLYMTASISLLVVAFIYLSHWFREGWNYHPIVHNLFKFCNNNNSWEDVASDINREFRRLEKICIQTTSITRIVATENWLIKITPLTLFFAYQSDTTLVVKQADTHELSAVSVNEVQYVTIEVKPQRDNFDSFEIRINALDFKDLQDRVARPISVSPNVKFHKTILEQFVDTFKGLVEKNPRYSTNQQLDQCIGCLQAEPNVKIQKLCEGGEGAGEGGQQNKCETCYCRPMWCVECVAKWFASRQEQEQPHTWLSSKGTCPMCRAKFCVLDVCLLETAEE